MTTKVTLYEIRKARKVDKSTVGYLSPKKVRWLPEGSTKHRIGKFTESEADEFIRKHESDPDHYYFKTLR